MRKAFKAEEGNTLVVADYGQLELRLLAHMAGCASMLEAFRLGGDFHSRTALGMYDHIKAAIDRGVLAAYSLYSVISMTACKHITKASTGCIVPTPIWQRPDSRQAELRLAKAACLLNM